MKTVEELKIEIRRAKDRYRNAIKASDKAYDAGESKKSADYTKKANKEQALIDSLNAEIDAILDIDKDAEVGETEEIEETEEIKSNKSDSTFNVDEIVAQFADIEGEENKDEEEEVEEESKEDKVTETKSPETKKQKKKSKKPLLPKELRTSTNTGKGDWPQHSYRVEPERFDELKSYTRGELVPNLKAWGSLAKMSSSLNNADLYGHQEVWLDRSLEQYKRFVDAACKIARGDIKYLPEIEVEMVRHTYFHFKAMNDAQKKELVQKFMKIIKTIEETNLYEFAHDFQAKITKQEINKVARTPKADKVA